MLSLIPHYQRNFSLAIDLFNVNENIEIVES